MPVSTNKKLAPIEHPFRPQAEGIFFNNNLVRLCIFMVYKEIEEQSHAFQQSGLQSINSHLNSYILPACQQAGIL